MWKFLFKWILSQVVKLITVIYSSIEPATWFQNFLECECNKVTARYWTEVRWAGGSPALSSSGTLCAQYGSRCRASTLKGSWIGLHWGGLSWRMRYRPWPGLASIAVRSRWEALLGISFKKGHPSSLPSHSSGFGKTAVKKLISSLRRGVSRIPFGQPNSQVRCVSYGALLRSLC